MIDQLKISNKYSYDDYEASVKERRIAPPTKKSIKDTVPFSNVTYDFSAINGEVYWNERPLEYIFEITALTVEELEVKKMAFTNWIMNVMDADIYDPFITDYHFKGSYDSMSFADEFEKTTITVTFTAYPYMISNMPKSYSITLAANTAVEVNIVNNSSHRITPTFNANVAATVTYNNASYAVPTGTTTDDYFKIGIGANVLTIKAATSGTITITFNEEVF